MALHAWGTTMAEPCIVTATALPNAEARTAALRMRTARSSDAVKKSRFKNKVSKMKLAPKPSVKPRESVSSADRVFSNQ